jgi:hypothetical protein
MPQVLLPIAHADQFGVAHPWRPTGDTLINLGIVLTSILLAVIQVWLGWKASQLDAK